MYSTHPAIFIGSMISAIILRAGSDKMQESQILNEIEELSEKFSIITSNLRNQYVFASKAVSESFLTGNTEEIVVTIQALIEGYGKDAQGSLQRFFDERDEDLNRLKVVEAVENE